MAIVIVLATSLLSYDWRDSPTGDFSKGDATYLIYIYYSPNMTSVPHKDVEQKLAVQINPKEEVLLQGASEIPWPF